MKAAARRKSISPSGLAQREDRRNPGEPTRKIEPVHFDSYGNSEAGFFEKVKIFVRPPIRRDETEGKPPTLKSMYGFDFHHRMEFPTLRSREDLRRTAGCDQVFVVTFERL